MTTSIDRCPACAGGSLAHFYHKAGVASHSCLLMRDEQEALTFPTGDLQIAFCESCGFVMNTAYDQGLARYSARYEETQGFSPLFQEYAADLAGRWVHKYDLYGKSVLELGCGKGEFLVDDGGAGSRLGDRDRPRRAPRTHRPGARRPDHLDRRLLHRRLRPPESGRGGVPAHARAHRAGRGLHALGPGGDRGPNRGRRPVRAAGRVADPRGGGTLGRLLRALLVFQRRLAGAAVPGDRVRGARRLPRIRRPVFDHRGAAVEVPARGEPLPIEDDVDRLRKSTRVFGHSVAESLGRWSAKLLEVSDAGGRVAIWGSGSKGVSFLAGLGEQARLVDYAVDVNPYKHGMFMAGSGHRIVAPDRLAADQPDLVVVMNPIYLEEIGLELARLGVRTELKAV